MGSRMGSGRQTLSAICRPLAEPMSETYLSISVSMMLDVSPVSSIECGSAGRKASSFKMEDSKLPAAPVAEEVSDPSVPAVIIVMLRKDERLAPVRTADGPRRLGNIGRELDCRMQDWLLRRAIE